MLTSQQAVVLKAAILANPVLSAFPLTADGFLNLRDALNADANPNFWVWSTNTEVQAIRAAVVWSNLTPNEAPDGTQAWANRSLQCQGKQFNLQMIIPFAGTFSGVDANIRNGLQDALQGVRSGAGGAVQDAGWAAVRNTLARKAKFVEQIFANTSGGDGSTRALSATMTFEGFLTAADIETARLS